MNDGDRIGIVGRNGDGKSMPAGFAHQCGVPGFRPRVTRWSGLWVGALSRTNTLDSRHTVGWTLVGDQSERQWASNPHIRGLVDGLVSDIGCDTTVATLFGRQRRRVQLVGDRDYDRAGRHRSPAARASVHPNAPARRNRIPQQTRAWTPARSPYAHHQPPGSRASASVARQAGITSVGALREGRPKLLRLAIQNALEKSPTRLGRRSIGSSDVGRVQECAEAAAIEN